MRPEKNAIIGWRLTTDAVKRQLSNITVFRAVLFFGLVAGLALSFTLYPNLVTNAQDQKPAPASEILITAQAEGIGVTGSDSVIPNEDLPNSPDGSVCTWANDVVYPIPVQDQAVAVAGTNLYSFSGQSNSAFTANSYRFNGTAWTPIAAYPTAVVGAGAASDGTNVYIIGGVATGGIFQTALNRYNTATDTYTPLAPVATATWNHVTLFQGGRIYKIGGSAATASTAVVEIYNIATNTWTAGAPLPQPSSFAHGFVSGNFIYVAGGLNSVGSVASLKTYRYDIAANTWDDAAIADLPQTRWAGVSSKVGFGSTGAFVIAGGFVNGTALTNASATVIEWNPATNTWTSNPDMPAARFRSNGGVLGSGFQNVGGAPPNFTGTNTNYRLTCATNVAVLNGGTVSITAESCGTPNGVPDPGETLSVTLPITNTGDSATTNLMATLQATGGVTNPGPAQNYGAVLPGGAAVTRTFTFTVAPGTVCGGNITLTFVLNDGATNYPNITRTFTTGVRAVALSQNFDGVTAPALPAGWTNTQISGTAINWVTTTTTPSSTPNAAFANDPTTVNLSSLTSPAVSIVGTDAQISFKNRFNTEDGFDGMVLEFSTNNGMTWTDIITGGGTFVSGGYTGALNTGFMNPLPGRQAWEGNSNGYIDTLINLPASLNGQSVRFRWLMGSDNSTAPANSGVWVDNVEIFGARVCQSCNPTVCNIQRRGDFAGDGRTDYTVFRPSTGTWFIQPNGAGAATGRAFGALGDRLQPVDYDGDGKTDIGVYRNGVWYWVRSSDSTLRAFTFGTSTDIPVAADYSGDGKAELAVYRPSTGVWYILNKETGAISAVAWGGAASDVPAIGDFDNDCKMDIAVRRTTNVTGPGATEWFILQSAGGATTVRWGLEDMQMAIGDYNGDGRSDVGVTQLRGGLLYWYVIGTTNNVIVNGIQFGQTGDLVTTGDYDGDARADLSVYRPSNSVFFYRAVLNATQFGYAFGTSGDSPVVRSNQYPLP